MTSPDGINWTERTVPQISTWTRVTWSATKGIFMAVGNTGTNHVMTSPDGINWTLQPNVIPDAIPLSYVEWVDAKSKFIATGNNGAIINGVLV